ncbi:glycosyltransferase [Helicobacter labetoulli]|uniref:glycosyltransferase n=1 Tax=Helicobacter labetoulli TaxID=2315333 RepID=UPI001FC983EF|nr:glycosyltransferase [Helicobacter labetoulli]
METRLMQFPLISIVSVVYNDVAHIVDTMDSVTAQDYPSIEYIIIDGASSDGTREKIMEYIASCADIDSKDNVDSKKCEEQDGRIYLEATHREKNLHFKFLSERDSGIYDAMNKGIDLATGQWCNFMNCGDRFYSNNTILELFTRFFVMHGGGGKA